MSGFLYRRIELPTGRFSIAVMASTLCFYAGPLLARLFQLPVTWAVMVTVSSAISAALVPRAILGASLPISLARLALGAGILVAAAMLRFASLLWDLGGSELRSGLSFLALVLVGVIYVYPSRSKS